MRQFCALAACAVALAGCQTDGSGTAVADVTGPPPASYRQIAAEYVKANFKDPYSIRDAEIAFKQGSGPTLVAGKMPWVVCVKANAKNAVGAYTGRKVTALGISSDRVTNAWDEAQYSLMTCQGAVYEPFAEIDEKRSR